MPRIRPMKRWHWNPHKWHWMTYTSPSNRYHMKWRGPLVISWWGGPGLMPGVILKHDTLSNQLWVVENPARPFGDGGYDCNLCVGVHHAGKATHLWLEPNGCCIVSTGVLAELQRAGMPQLTVTGHVDAPPALKIGEAPQRDIIDNQNRALWVPDPILEGVT